MLIKKPHGRIIAESLSPRRLTTDRQARGAGRQDPGCTLTRDVMKKDPRSRY